MNIYSGVAAESDGGLYAEQSGDTAVLFVAGVLRGLREVRSRDENIARGLYIAAHRQRASTSLLRHNLGPAAISGRAAAQGGEMWSVRRVNYVSLVSLGGWDLLWL